MNKISTIASAFVLAAVSATAQANGNRHHEGWGNNQGDPSTTVEVANASPVANANPIANANPVANANPIINANPENTINAAPTANGVVKTMYQNETKINNPVNAPAIRAADPAHLCQEASASSFSVFLIAGGSSETKINQDCMNTLVVPKMLDNMGHNAAADAMLLQNDSIRQAFRAVKNAAPKELNETTTRLLDYTVEVKAQEKKKAAQSYNWDMDM